MTRRRGPSQSRLTAHPRGGPLGSGQSALANGHGGETPRESVDPGLGSGESPADAGLSDSLGSGYAATRTRAVRRRVRLTRAVTAPPSRQIPPMTMPIVAQSTPPPPSEVLTGLNGAGCPYEE